MNTIKSIAAGPVGATWVMGFASCLKYYRQAATASADGRIWTAVPNLRQ